MADLDNNSSQPQQSLKQVIQEILAFALPASIGSFLNLGQMAINLIFIGHLNDPVKLAAVGVGTMILNMAGVAPQLGINSGLETLVSQAKGANNLELCGLYLQRGRAIVMIAFIPMLAVFLISKHVLMSLGQDPDVMSQAYDYTLVMTPSIFVMGLLDIQRKFMIQMGLSDLQMKTQIVVTTLHLFWNNLFVYYLGLGIVGTGISSFITNVLGLFLNVHFTRQCDDFDKICAISQFDKRVFENISIYLNIGLPNVTIIMLDWTCFEITAVMSGYIGVGEQAFNVIALNLITIVFQIPYGFQQAGCALIGQRIGAGKVQEAKAMKNTLIRFITVINCFETLVFYLIRQQMVIAFTSQASVLRIADETMIMIVIVFAMDFQQGCLLGPLKALGQQTNAMYVNIVTYYVFVIPLAYYFSFRCKILNNGQKPLGLFGLWLGFVIGLLHQIIMYSVLIRGTDWDQASLDAQERQQCDLMASTNENDSYNQMETEIEKS